MNFCNIKYALKIRSVSNSDYNIYSHSNVGSATKKKTVQMSYYVISSTTYCTQSLSSTVVRKWALCIHHTVVLTG